MNYALVLLRYDQFGIMLIKPYIESVINIYENNTSNNNSVFCYQIQALNEIRKENETKDVSFFLITYNMCDRDSCFN